MFTHNYKGMYIQGHCAKPECTVQGFGMHGRTFKSYRAAQLAITKAVKRHDAAMMVLVRDVAPAINVVAPAIKVEG